MAMNEKEQLFAKFFAEESQLVAAMTFEQLEAHIIDLEEILLEGRARAQAAVESKKVRVAKLSKEERDKLITKQDINISEAINGVQRRKDRMSKADKLLESLKDLGLSKEEIDRITGTVKIDEAKQPQANKIVASFNEEDKAKQREAEAAKAIEEATKQIEAKPTFNPDDLFN